MYIDFFSTIKRRVSRKVLLMKHNLQTRKKCHIQKNGRNGIKTWVSENPKDRGNSTVAQQGHIASWSWILVEIDKL